LEKVYWLNAINSVKFLLSTHFFLSKPPNSKQEKVQYVAWQYASALLQLIQPWLVIAIQFGLLVGEFVGELVGILVEFVGVFVGKLVGKFVGELVGKFVKLVGKLVGELVG